MNFTRCCFSLLYSLFVTNICFINISWAITSPPSISIQEPTVSSSNKLIPPKESEPITNNPKQILARINDHPITVNDVETVLKTLPKEIQSLPKDMIYPQIIKQIALDQAILTRIKEEHIDQQPKVKQDIAEATQNLIKDKLIKAFFLQKITPLLTQTAIQSFYNKHYLHQPPVKEVHLKRIIVQTKTIADMALNELKKGKNFEDIARIYSIDLYNRDEKKADIGWFTKKELEPDVANATFALANNAYTETPLQMNNGWVILKKTAERNRPPPSLPQIESQIKEHITAEAINNLYEESLKNSLFITY